MNHGQLFRDACDDASIAEVAEVLDELKRARILDAADRAMLAYAEKMTHTPHQMKKTDSEENIVDIIAAAAYRNFANSINYAYGHVEQNPKGPKELKAAIQRLKKKIRG